jgi:hypothetical protein
MKHSFECGELYQLIVPKSVPIITCVNSAFASNVNSTNLAFRTKAHAECIGKLPLNKEMDLVSKHPFELLKAELHSTIN